MASQRSIAIVGAGPGGLVCARVLQMHNIPVVVYEKEATSRSRQQGGSLDMHPDSGFKVLQMTELIDEFNKLAWYEDQNMKIIGTDGTVHFDDPELLEQAGNRPEVDRFRLRQIFLDSLKPGVWNHSVSKVTQQDEKVTLHFLDSALEPAVHDFVVGADGAWSHVRPILSSTVPEYTGITYVDIFIKDVAKNHSNLAAYVKGGMVMVLGDNKGIIPQRSSNDVVRVYAAFRKPLAWPDEIGLKSLVEAGRFREAGELLVKQFDGDGAELATVIAESMSANKDSWAQAIKAFEDQMQRRAWAEEDDGLSMDHLISDGDSAARAGEMMRNMMAAATSS
ncbi:FAD-dependent monooxygenase [Mycena sanguinolenta]|uniref:FAD-dependent monooxygenase n=1 Tax=Mycena sanguinolenta TaxID=230812 RepID=A0A8H7DJ98_9AGAR|nr:FAD-dependent monooxygenase [Mycena sanguinolenta]